MRRVWLPLRGPRRSRAETVTAGGRFAVRAGLALGEGTGEQPHFEPEPALPTLMSGDIALTSTPPKDGASAWAQVLRRQPDGTWLRLLDQPEFVSPGR